MRGKILIVEDLTDWRELLQGILQREGYEVESTATLQEAQDHINQVRDLDLAILDIRLVETDEANQDGMRLLGELHEQRTDAFPCAFTKVIMFTGHGTMESQRKAFREFHAFDFFRKEQFDSEEFRQAVREAVELATHERRAWKQQDYMRGHHYEAWRREQA
jgi:DNA-binding NtrC family response regulator